MRYIISFILCLALLLCFAGCIDGGKESESTAPSVISSVTDGPADSMPQESASEDFEVTTTNKGDIELPKVEF